MEGALSGVGHARGGVCRQPPPGLVREPSARTWRDRCTAAAPAVTCTAPQCQPRSRYDGALR